jgi:hypothetical protein
VRTKMTRKKQKRRFRRIETTLIRSSLARQTIARPLEAIRRATAAVEHSLDLSPISLLETQRELTGTTWDNLSNQIDVIIHQRIPGEDDYAL